MKTRKTSAKSAKNRKSDALLRQSCEQLSVAVRTARAQHRLSQDDLALRAQITRATVQRIENDDASCQLATLARIAAVFEMNVFDFVAAYGARPTPIATKQSAAAS